MRSGISFFGLLFLVAVQPAFAAYPLPPQFDDIFEGEFDSQYAHTDIGSALAIDGFRRELRSKGYALSALKAVAGRRSWSEIRALAEDMPERLISVAEVESWPLVSRYAFIDGCLRSEVHLGVTAELLNAPFFRDYEHQVSILKLIPPMKTDTLIPLGLKWLDTRKFSKTDLPIVLSLIGSPHKTFRNYYVHLAGRLLLDVAKEGTSPLSEVLLDPKTLRAGLLSTDPEVHLAALGLARLKLHNVEKSDVSLLEAVLKAKDGRARKFFADKFTDEEWTGVIGHLLKSGELAQVDIGKLPKRLWWIVAKVDQYSWVRCAWRVAFGR